MLYIKHVAQSPDFTSCHSLLSLGRILKNKQHNIALMSLNDEIDVNCISGISVRSIKCLTAEVIETYV